MVQCHSDSHWLPNFCEILDRLVWKTECSGGFLATSTPLCNSDPFFSTSFLQLSGMHGSVDWIVVVQSFSGVQLFAVSWTAACQNSLSFTKSWSKWDGEPNFRDEIDIWFDLLEGENNQVFTSFLVGDAAHGKKLGEETLWCSLSALFYWLTCWWGGSEDRFWVWG